MIRGSRPLKHLPKREFAGLCRTFHHSSFHSGTASGLSSQMRALYAGNVAMSETYPCRSCTPPVRFTDHPSRDPEGAIELLGRSGPVRQYMSHQTTPLFYCTVDTLVWHIASPVNLKTGVGPVSSRLRSGQNGATFSLSPPFWPYLMINVIS